ncbi:MAG: 3-hydroxyacyl-CoA dehydrogenase family protein [Planctomycetales bacterium]
MTVDDIRKVAVIGGAGLMGHGIALEFALAGFQVTVCDVDEDALNRGWDRIHESLQLLQQCGLAKPDTADLALGRIEAGTDVRAAVDEVDVVVESIDENLEQKRAVFRQLDEYCPPRAILTSNSSSFTPSLMAGATTRPQQFLGMHYFNPPYLIPLVEVIPGEQTSDATVELMTSLLKRLGKTPVLVRREVPGFIANRIQAAVWREILKLVADGVATPEDIDLVMTSSLGRRWSVAGPFEITDLAGLDLKQAILTELLPSLASSADVPAILNEMVEQGNLGVKTGNGFREWTPEKVRDVKQRLARALTTIAQWDAQR